VIVRERGRLFLVAANKANAQKSSGPLSKEGKLRSAKNAVKHGLSAQFSNSPKAPFSMDERQEAPAYQQELVALGYSVAQAHAMIEALSAARHVIEIKHECYTDRLNEKRMGNMTLEAIMEAVHDFLESSEGVTMRETGHIIKMTQQEVTKDNDLASLLYEKFEAHRKLLRYERRAFNQLRKSSGVKK